MGSLKEQYFMLYGTENPKPATEEERLNSVDNLKRWGFKTNKCLCCGKSNSEAQGRLMQCARCKKAYYCSNECYNEHLPVHQKVCTAKGTLCKSPTRSPRRLQVKPTANVPLTSPRTESPKEPSSKKTVSPAVTSSPTVKKTPKSSKTPKKTPKQGIPGIIDISLPSAPLSPEPEKTTLKTKKTPRKTPKKKKPTTPGGSKTDTPSRAKTSKTKTSALVASMPLPLFQD